MKNYKGFAYPVEKNAKGFFYGGDDVSQIKANFLTIIMTKPGERVFEPYFGTPLHALNLNQPVEILEEQCKAMIAEALSIWEPRFPVTGLDVKVMGREATIVIKFVDPVHLQTEHSLTLQLPLE